MSRLLELKRRKIVENEFFQRKEKADAKWNQIMARIEKGEIPDRFEVASAMDACNMADGAILFQKHKR